MDGLIGTAATAPDRRQTCDSRWSGRVEVGFRLPDSGRASTDHQSQSTRTITLESIVNRELTFLTELDFQSTRQLRKSKYNLGLVILELSALLPRLVLAITQLTQDVLTQNIPII